MSFIYFIIFLLIVFFLNSFLKRKKILINSTGESHQTLTSKEIVPLTGGIYLIISFFVLFHNSNIVNLIIILFFFLVGLFSDIKILKSPILRLILQIFCTFLFLYYNEIRLENTRILFLDNILNYQFNCENRCDS